MGKQCRTGKVTYGTRNAAVIARERQLKKKSRLLHVYQCGDCKKWHLGNNQMTRLENINSIFDHLPISDRCIDENGVRRRD